MDHMVLPQCGLPSEASTVAAVSGPCAVEPPFSWLWMLPAPLPMNGACNALGSLASTRPTPPLRCNSPARSCETRWTPLGICSPLPAFILPLRCLPALYLLQSIERPCGCCPVHCDAGTAPNPCVLPTIPPQAHGIAYPASFQIGGPDLPSHPSGEAADWGRRPH